MTIEEQVQTYIVENFMFGDEEDLETSQSLLESGVVDSTGVMELVLFVEETFGVKVDDNDLVPENLDTIESIARFVKSKLAKTPTASSPPSPEIES